MLLVPPNNHLVLPPHCNQPLVPVFCPWPHAQLIARSTTCCLIAPLPLPSPPHLCDAQQLSLVVEHCCFIAPSSSPPPCLTVHLSPLQLRVRPPTAVAGSGALLSPQGRQGRGVWTPVCVCPRTAVVEREGVW